ncbi:winged helix-turn-helix domain-containing protein [Parahaliea mediterranea]|uniref:Winged helix-turn-helix transcriptional regulator n=1 Tax=Parahaliea mediterranea TaxID=651086 RepID=A0A939IJ86_9GAMM|nr:winged helix-turn-helix domain-containing protein [Parahaliea mediterranea]MBN7797384.1 winged helix-turn-helix transcriptional regulator [Parahaliea mediterranea]
MIEAIVGSEGAERVLLFLAARGSGYPREIANSWSMDVSTVQNQLLRMERDGLLVSRKVGRTRVFEFNPRYVFKDEVKALLAKALKQLPSEVLEQLTLLRTRPRRTGKPL